MSLVKSEEGNREGLLALIYKTGLLRGSMSFERCFVDAQRVRGLKDEKWGTLQKGNSREICMIYNNFISFEL
jgi:hypothetical protein